MKAFFPNQTFLVAVFTLFVIATSCNQNEVNKLMGEAKMHKANGECPKAIELYTKVLELEKDNTDAMVRRGYCYALAGNTKKALKNLTMAIEIEPDNNAAVFNRAGIYMQTKQYQKALNDYTALMTRQAQIKNLEALYNQAKNSVETKQ